MRVGVTDMVGMVGMGSKLRTDTNLHLLSSRRQRMRDGKVKGETTQPGARLYKNRECSWCVVSW